MRFPEARAFRIHVPEREIRTFSRPFERRAGLSARGMLGNPIPQAFGLGWYVSAPLALKRKNPQPGRMFPRRWR